MRPVNEIKRVVLLIAQDNLLIVDGKTSGSRYKYKWIQQIWNMYFNEQYIMIKYSYLLEYWKNR